MPPMHAAFFGLKRAYQSTLKITRKDLAAFGLTSARFDLLYAIARDPLGWIAQSRLRRVLGVSRTTVSRMVTALESLGLLGRTRDPTDGRQRIIRLTRGGRARLRLAFWRFVTTGLADLVVDSALAGSRWVDDTCCFFALSSLDDALWQMRRTYGDGATLQYVWHPDD